MPVTKTSCLVVMSLAAITAVAADAGVPHPI